MSTENELTRDIEKIVSKIITPKNKQNFLDFGASIDNVDFHDFSQYIYATTPLYKQLSSSTTTDDSQEITDALEEEEIDIADYDLFNRKLSAAFANLLENLPLHHSHLSPLSDLELLARTLARERIMRALSNMHSFLITFVEIWWALPASQKIILVSFLANNYFPGELYNQATAQKFYANIGRDEFKMDNIVNPPEYWHQNWLNEQVNKLGSPFPDEDLQTLWSDLEYLVKETWSDLTPNQTDFEDTVECNYDQEYPFNLYRRGTWNIGLRLIYRQEWKPLGNQRGELVRTLPLGPKQIEKISTKTVKRNKINQTSES